MLRRARVAAILVAACLLLGGCVALPGTYDRVDAAVRDLGLDEVGPLSQEQHRGGILFSGPPTYSTIVEGAPAEEALRERLGENGYVLMTDRDGTSTWDLITVDGHILVSLAPVRTGEPVRLRESGSTFTSDVDGAVIELDSRADRSFRPEETEGLAPCPGTGPVRVADLDDGQDRTDCDLAGRTLVLPDGYEMAANAILVTGASMTSDRPYEYHQWNLGVYGMVVARVSCEGDGTEWWGRGYAVALIQLEDGTSRCS